MSLFNTRKEGSRKERSEKFLLSQSVRINPNLPEIANEADAEIKSPEEAVRRVVCAFLAAQIAIDICNGETGTESAEFFTNIIRELGLENELTDDEKKYFALADESAPRISPEDANQFQWRIEMCMPLFWACGFLGDDDLSFPSDITDTTDLIRLLGGCHSFEDVMSHVKMHTVSEILDNADVCLRMDWACVEARIKNDRSICGNLMSDVVMEQHKGFNWLIGAFDAEDWDNVRAHT
ncbi:MAG: DUF4272 domain-containing protein [Oscillospiraceae bacterium]|nr:DUF4272 domain-containing protein [Oscillospiraceae bacterium]